MGYLITWIGEAIGWILSILLNTVLSPIYFAFYWIFIHVPLILINGMVQMFLFFASGLLPQVFGTTVKLDPKTDKIIVSYNFNIFSTQFGTIVMLFFIFGLVCFFFYFLLSFSKKTQLDEKGNPVSNTMTTRFMAMRWPFFMGGILVLTPIVLAILDFVMGSLLANFATQRQTPFTQAELDGIRGNFATQRLAWQSFGTAGAAVWVTTPGITWTDNLNDTLTVLKRYANGWYNDILNDTNQDEGFANFSYAFQNIDSTIQEIQNKILQQAGAGAAINNVLQSIRAGNFITGSQAQIIRDNASSYNLLSEFSSLNQLFKYVDPSGGTQIKNAWDTIRSHNGSGSTDDWTVIFDGDKRTLNEQITYFQTGMSIIHSEYGDSKSYLNSFISLTDANAHSYLILSSPNGVYKAMVKEDGRVDVNVVMLLYTIVTGDPIATNWDASSVFASSKGEYFTTNNIFTLIVGAMVCWGMVLVIYTYLSAIISRLFYIIGYWVVGFVYLANGMNKEAEVGKWYKTLFSYWYGVVVVFLCFYMAGFMLDILKDPILNGLSAEKGDWIFGGVGNDSSSNLFARFGIMFAIEGSYQTFYLVYKAYMKDAGANDSAGNASGEKSFMFSTGRKLASDSANQAKRIVLARPVAEYTTAGLDSLQWWGNQKMKAYGSAMAHKNAVDRMLSNDTNTDRLIEAGYKPKKEWEIFQRTNPALPYDSKEKYSTEELEEFEAQDQKVQDMISSVRNNGPIATNVLEMETELPTASHLDAQGMPDGYIFANMKPNEPEKITAERNRLIAAGTTDKNTVDIKKIIAKQQGVSVEDADFGPINAIIQDKKTGNFYSVRVADKNSQEYKNATKQEKEKADLIRDKIKDKHKDKPVATPIAKKFAVVREDPNVPGQGVISF